MSEIGSSDWGNLHWVNLGLDLAAIAARNSVYPLLVCEERKSTCISLGSSTLYVGFTGVELGYTQTLMTQLEGQWDTFMLDLRAVAVPAKFGQNFFLFSDLLGRRLQWLNPKSLFCSNCKYMNTTVERENHFAFDKKQKQNVENKNPLNETVNRACEFWFNGKEAHLICNALTVRPNLENGIYFPVRVKSLLCGCAHHYFVNLFVTGTCLNVKTILFNQSFSVQFSEEEVVFLNMFIYYFVLICIHTL